MSEDEVIDLVLSSKFLSKLIKRLVSALKLIRNIVSQTVVLRPAVSQTECNGCSMLKKNCSTRL